MNDKDQFKNYFSNISWLFLERAYRVIVGFTVGVWTIKYLGAEQFGLFSYSQSIFFIFSPIAAMGLDSTLVRELVNNPSQKNILLGSAFTIKLIGSIATILLSTISILLISSDDTTRWLVLIISLGTLFQSLNIIDLFFQSISKNHFTVKANLFSITIANTLKLGLIIFNFSILWFAIIATFEILLTCIALLVFYKKSNSDLLHWKYNHNTAKYLINKSAPLLASTIAVSVFLNIDQILITKAIGLAANGQYAAAIKINGVFSLLVSAYIITITPIFYEAKKKSDIDLKNKTYQTLLIVYAYYIICLAFIIITADYLILFLYGEEFTTAATILKIYAVSNLFSYWGAVSNRWYLANNLEKKILQRNLLGMCIAPPLIGTLIYYYGVIGAAAGSIAIQFFTNVLADFFDRKTREFGKSKLKTLLLIRD